MKKTLILASALALASVSNFALAAEGKGFVRAELGRSHVDIDVSGIGSGSENDTSYSLRGGYYFTENFAVEGFYSNLFDKSVDGDSAELSAIGVGVVGKKNFGANNTGFFIDGRVGVAHGNLDTNFGLDGNSTKPYVGVGVGYDFNENVGLSLNYDYLKGNGDGISITAKPLTLGVEVRF
ncbi:outer membrane beta-barrel protein [Lysobacter fragariae]